VTAEATPQVLQRQLIHATARFTDEHRARVKAERMTRLLRLTVLRQQRELERLRAFAPEAQRLG